MVAINRPEIECTWIWGQTGIGKSAMARKMCQDEYYPKSVDKWWCGYRGEQTVIIDDIAPIHAREMGDFLKVWCDRYKCIAQKKCGSVALKFTRLIITSNYDITDVWAESTY